MVRNKMYAILKHLLTPGRYYLFRVAAVNVYGTCGFWAIWLLNYVFIKMVFPSRVIRHLNLQKKLKVHRWL